MNNRPDNNKKKDLQFIVNDGIIYAKRDIMNLLWDLGFVTYYEVEGERVVNKGKGFIMRVSSNSEDPTLFLNGRIYINVSSVDYLRVKKIKEDQTLYELHSTNRIIKIIPDTKKQAYPPFRYVADTMVGMGVIGEELPPEGLEGPMDDFRDLPPDGELN
ncbi:MAG: hypothetical protein NTZ10_04440 [Candidatus Saganbacteria bacterium]|nr:hypothetical protein [Candidatus Saganbacteria bacterium]